jgi:hypothetical protein
VLRPAAVYIVNGSSRVLVTVGKMIIITLPDVPERDNFDNVKDRVSPCAWGRASLVFGHQTAQTGQSVRVGTCPALRVDIINLIWSACACGDVSLIRSIITIFFLWSARRVGFAMVYVINLAPRAGGPDPE